MKNKPPVVEGIDKHRRTSYVFMTNEARALKKLREAKGLSMKKAGELLGYKDIIQFWRASSILPAIVSIKSFN